jgi:hypothetical protein
VQCPCDGRQLMFLSLGFCLRIHLGQINTSLLYLCQAKNTKNL